MPLKVDDWFEQRSYKCDQFAALGKRLKNNASATVTLVLPTRNVANTIGPILSQTVETSKQGRSLVDQVIVVDGDSTDDTPDIAREYGAEVYSESDLMPHYGRARGKGDALWRSLSVARGDIVMFADSDTLNFDRKFVYGILGPLLTIPEVQFVKGAYRRPFAIDSVSLDDGGGRVTEIIAKPLISLFYPDLSGFVQPLAGEFAAHKDLLSSVPFLTGYGVDIGVLIDIFRSLGLYSMAQVDLGVRQNRHQKLIDLSRMSHTIMRAVTHRISLPSQSAVALISEGTEGWDGVNAYRHARAADSGLLLETHYDDLTERPPMKHALAARKSR